MRFPAVANAFYPAIANSLERDVDSFLVKAREEVKSVDALAIICPHAGYIYSGQTAAYSFASIENLLKKENTTVVLIGPNHTGLGKIVSVSFDDWKTPIGTSMCDVSLAGAIIKQNPMIERDEQAHMQEHSLEVQLPFLQKINPKIRVVCICLGSQAINVDKIVGKAVFDACLDEKFSDRNIVLLASSDFTHQESGERAAKLDSGPTESIKKLDNDALMQEVEEKRISICGAGAIAAVIEYCKLKGAKSAEILRYTNSGKETNGDESSVVAYASFVIKNEG